LAWQSGAPAQSIAGSGSLVAAGVALGEAAGSGVLI
jgi:hypothetical protein